MTHAAPALSAHAMRRGLLAAKGYYLALFAALGALAPFFNIYLQQNGLSGTQIGLLATVPPLVAIAASPFWGGVADRWQAHRLVLALCAIGAGTASLAFLSARSFAAIMAVLILVAFFRNPIAALVDSAVMSMIAADPRVSYGSQRAWGSVGFVAGSTGLGLLVASAGLPLIFWAHGAALILVGATLSWLLPVPHSLEPVDLRSGLGRLFRLRAYRGLVGQMFFFGMGVAAYINFLGLHIVELGGGTREAGLAFALGALAEIPVMFLGRHWFARVSYPRTIVGGMLGYALVWLVLGFVQAPWQVLAFVPLGGLCSGMIWMSVAPLANAGAPDGLRASAQAIAQAAQGGLGWALGSALGGVLWDVAGGPWVFSAAALCALAGAAVFAWGARQ